MLYFGADINAEFSNCNVIALGSYVSLPNRKTYFTFCKEFMVFLCALHIDHGVKTRSHRITCVVNVFKSTGPILLAS